jgi:hypothetical protein
MFHDIIGPLVPQIGDWLITDKWWARSSAATTIGALVEHGMANKVLHAPLRTELRHQEYFMKQSDPSCQKSSSYCGTTMRVYN